jgi:tetratricopeptide (TPR) repeat protein
VPLERIAAKLVEIAERYKALQEEVQPAPGDDPRVAELKAHATKAIKQGELERADEFLIELAEAQEAVHERAAHEVAATYARRGEVALARLRYDDAAGRFAQAAALLASSHEEVRTKYREHQADALYRQGEERGDNAALINAIALYRAALQELTRERVPLNWAMTQNNLGTALQELGRRESGTARLEQAVEAYRAALQERTRERVPLNWAMTQNNLGTALQELGSRERKQNLIKDALEAIKAAHEVYRDAGTHQHETFFISRIENLKAQIAMVNMR